MRSPSRKVLLMLIAIALLVFIVCICFFAGSKSDPGLSVTYVGTVDGKGHWRLSFGITNVGKSTVFTSSFGEIELVNHTNVLSVGATAPMSKLGPGQGHVVDAVLSEAQMKMIDGKWRYRCWYAADGVRSRIYRWQWGPNGPGARVNWLIP